MMLKRIIAFFAAAAMLPVSAVYAYYTDVPSDSWYYESVAVASSAGWFSGYEDGKFMPDGTITRAEAIKVLLTFKYGDGLPQTEENIYNDVSDDAWYVKYVSSNAALNIIPSDEDMFRPEEKITREDAMYGIISVLDIDTSKTDLSVLDVFSDSDQIDDSKKAQVAEAVEREIVGGYEDSTVRPKGNITRAEFAAIMLRASSQDETVSTPAPSASAEPSESPKPSTDPDSSPSPSASPKPQQDGENLFDYTYVAGTMIDTSKGTEKAGTSYITSDYISVIPGAKYFCATYSPITLSYADTCTAYAYYDADKQFISGGTKSMKTPVAVPDKAEYIRFSIKQPAGLTDNDRLAKYTVFAKSDEAITEYIYSSDEKTTDKFDGMKVYLYGDGFIQNGSGWIDILERNIGVQINEVYGTLSFGGNTKNSFYTTENINKIPEDADYILIYGGVNDWINGYLLGDINDMDENTVSGGISLLNKRLKERCKDAEIVYITPCDAEIFGRSDFSADGRTNRQKYSLSEYADIIKTQAEADGMKVIDLNKESGIDKDNIDNYIPKNGNNKIYPNEEGCKLIGEYLLSEIIK